MPNKTKLLKWIVPLAAVVAVLALPVAAQATLVFSRNPLQPKIWVAKDNGSGARVLAQGSTPKISPDGQTVVFSRIQKAHGYRPELVAIAASGKGGPRVLLSNWEEPFVFAWSPDSSTVAVVAGHFNAPRRLILLNVATGSQVTIAKGYFSGVSFSPAGDQLVYSKAPSENYPQHPDVYRFDLGSGQTVRLTKDHVSEDPLWGPNEEIVFDKLQQRRHNRFEPTADLFLMNPEGRQVKRLTHTKVPFLLFGLSPVQWSASGNQLLTEFSGEDTTYAVTVNPKTGAERPLTKERETGFVGDALSADGTTVLGSIGGFEPGPGHKVVTIPYKGGKPKVLANNASEPDWNR